MTVGKRGPGIGENWASVVVITSEVTLGVDGWSVGGARSSESGIITSAWSCLGTRGGEYSGKRDSRDGIKDLHYRELFWGYASLDLHSAEFIQENLPQYVS